MWNVHKHFVTIDTNEKCFQDDYEVISEVERWFSVKLAKFFCGDCIIKIYFIELRSEANM